MQMLFQYSQQNPQFSPPEALRCLVTTLQAQAPNLAFPSGPMNPAMQQAQNARAPNAMQAPSQFASPAMAHLGLPGTQGSPHVGSSGHASPMQSQLPGPPGMAQQGQMQQPPPANASPSVNNKRRRASAVKTEGDDGSGGLEVNGTASGAPKVKPSPKVGGKRQKGSA